MIVTIEQVKVVVGTKTCKMDVLNTVFLEHPAVGFPEVDVPFLVFPGDAFHGETCLEESMVDLVAYLESLERDAWAYDGVEVFGT